MEETEPWLSVDTIAPICVIDERLTIRGWSGGAETHSGLARTDVEGRNCWEVLRLRRSDGTPICTADCAVAAQVRAGSCAMEHRAKLPPEVAGGAEVCVASFPLDVASSRFVVHMFLPAVEDEPAATRRRGLTPRQLEILRYVESGQTTKEIARDLGLSVYTVRNHIQTILRRLDVPTRLQAVLEARKHGLL